MRQAIEQFDTHFVFNVRAQNSHLHVLKCERGRVVTRGPSRNGKLRVIGGRKAAGPQKRGQLGYRRGPTRTVLVPLLLLDEYCR